MELWKTVLHPIHVSLGAQMVEFGGWEMPLQYPGGCLQEHLTTRKTAGLFDVSHMGRFVVRGRTALPFLQHVLTNNALALDLHPVGAQYTLIPSPSGSAVDDAYLYRFVEGEYLLVVNAANRQKDLTHLLSLTTTFPDLEITDRSEELAMLALQGPTARSIVAGIIDAGPMPEPVRNAVGTVKIGGVPVLIGRTGYTGEPLCFELFVPATDAPRLWSLLIQNGAAPVGLAARDTLRLEAGLPLYGHELGTDCEGKQIPIFAISLAKFAVSLSPHKGEFVGRAALTRQFAAFAKNLVRDYSAIADLPRSIKPLAVAGRGVARAGARVFKEDRNVGYVTSGTMVPYWVFEDLALLSKRTDEHRLRSICLAYVDSDLVDDDRVTIEIRGKQVDALVVPYHLRSEAPPYARPIVYDHLLPGRPSANVPVTVKIEDLVTKSVANTRWRQEDCVNLIPSEMTTSPLVRLLSVMDPAFRYAEHRESKALYEAEVFYYQGTDFIGEVEALLEEELRTFLGCPEIDARVISGQMANATVFSALVDYLNRADRRSEQRRIRYVVNHRLGKGGHLSAQPMGALRDFVARDPVTERPAVVNFPVLAENPYKIDVAATLDLIAAYRPELIIFGKSMVLHKEPVAEIRRYLDAEHLNAVVMYDMAHVLGLIGPHFQQPFEEGADLVTGSTHKTYFGTQRGVIGGRFREEEERYELWEAIRRRAFPGAVSNHHLGTLLGLLMAAYEMNHFKDMYQPTVLTNAKAFARALKSCGLDVAGDPDVGYTETHQVVVRVGYSQGPLIARRLEDNNIICNFQACPDEEGFTASGALRMGVAEMTRFGMVAADFQAVAELIAAAVMKDARVAPQVKAMRSRFRELQFCFQGKEYAPLIEKLHRFI